MTLRSTLPHDHDWHLHTTLSDGFAAPEDVVRQAATLGLHSIAITDHDCLDAHRGGVLARLGATLGVQVVVGAELDCSVGEQETEVLAYHFDPESSGLVAHLLGVQEQRRERFRFYCYGMAAAGHPIDPEAVIHCGARVLIKVHFYRALQAAGVSFEGGYKGYKAALADLGAPPPVAKPPLDQVVALVREAGGTAVLAHPLYYREDIGLETLLRAGAAAGCAGVELVYPYRFGAKGLGLSVVRPGLAELEQLVPRFFPDDPLLTRGTDMHDPTEWQGRLEELGG